MSTPLSTLQEQLEARFPDANISIDAPSNPNGLWLMDIEYDGQFVNVAWHPQHRFGVSARDTVFGELPDETFDDVDSTFARIKRLLLSGASTAAPKEVTLPGLRRRAEVSQVNLAERLNVTQASVSKTERRTDLLIRTLRAYVNALGGTLEIRAHFGDETVRVILDPSEKT